MSEPQRMDRILSARWFRASETECALECVGLDPHGRRVTWFRKAEDLGHSSTGVLPRLPRTVRMDGRLEPHDGVDIGGDVWSIADLYDGDKPTIPNTVTYTKKDTGLHTTALFRIPPVPAGPTVPAELFPEGATYTVDDLRKAHLRPENVEVSVGTVRMGKALIPCRACAATGGITGNCARCHGVGVVEVSVGMANEFSRTDHPQGVHAEKPDEKTARWAEVREELSRRRDGNALKRAFESHKRLVEPEVKPVRAEPVERTLSCPTCRRVFCKVKAEPAAFIEVLCEGCLAEGRAP